LAPDLFQALRSLARPQPGVHEDGSSVALEVAGVAGAARSEGSDDHSFMVAQPEVRSSPCYRTALDVLRSAFPNRPVSEGSDDHSFMVAQHAVRSSPSRRTTLDFVSAVPPHRS